MRTLSMYCSARWISDAIIALFCPITTMALERKSSIASMALKVWSNISLSLSMPTMGFCANCVVLSTWVLSWRPVSAIRFSMVLFTPLSMSITLIWLPVARATVWATASALMPVVATREQPFIISRPVFLSTSSAR